MNTGRSSARSLSNYCTRRGRRAFTLIELLIVVAIIAILALIAVTNISLAKRRANQAKCASNLKAIAYAIYAYKLDLNKFPLADGIAGEQESMGQTQPGNGPAANGSWDGVPRVLLRFHYLSSPDYLYCPVHRDRHRGPRVQNFRYAYNNAAFDTGGSSSSANNMETDSHDIWYARCLWVPVERSFKPGDADVTWPHGENQDRENALMSNSRVELRDGKADFESAYP
jgi:prepilin-type N-terminal cleavage/methylation domain-containing protein